MIHLVGPPASFSFDGGGALVFGLPTVTPTGEAPLRYVPLRRTSSHPAYYVVTLSSVILGSVDLEQRAYGIEHDFARGYGSVLDSGTRPLHLLHLLSRCYPLYRM